MDFDSKYLNFDRQRTISWSKNGFIAYSIPSQRENLLLTYLENINGKSWQLAPPQKLIIKPSDNGIPELTLIEWSNLSTDLAVVDVHGNFYIMLSGVGLVNESSNNNNNMGHHSKPNSIHGSSSSLNINNPSSLNGSATNGSGSSPSYELTSYNHLELIYKDIINPTVNQKPNSSLQFIAFKWLPIEKIQLVSKEAKVVNLENVENNDNKKFAYSYGLTQHHPNNLCHPISTKQSCLAVRSNGELLLYYQGEHKVEYHKLSVDLNKGINRKLRIIKADFGFPNEKFVVLVTFDEISQRIRTYKITINWGFLLESANKQKTDPHYNTPKELQTPPKLSFEIIHEMSPLDDNEFNSVIYEDEEDTATNTNFDKVKLEDDMDIDSNEYKPKLLIRKITAIDIISPIWDDDDVMDIFITYYNYDEKFNISTSVFRYRLIQGNNAIINIFGEIGNNNNSNSNDHNNDKENNIGEYNVSLIDQTIVPKRVVGFQGLTCSISLVCDDGAIETFQRSSTSIMHINELESPISIPESIKCLNQVGYKLPSIKISKPIIFAFSPFLTSFAYFELGTNNIDLNINFVEKSQCLEISPEELYKSSVGFALYHSFACYFNINSDDLIIIIQLEIERVSKQIEKLLNKDNKVTALDSFIESIICESHKAINFQLDVFNKETVDKLLSNPPLQKLLSLQLMLGGLEGRLNNISENIAWIVLNLRSCSFGIMFSLSSIYRQISKKKPTEDTLQDSISRGESIISLTGNVRWLVELIIYLNQEILELYMSKKLNRKSKINMENSIVLPILISKVPRLFLMYALSSISKTQEVFKRLNKDLMDSNKLFTPMKDALNRYFTSCINSPLNLTLFEMFIKECDNYIGKEMNEFTVNNSKSEVLKLEQQMLCHGKISNPHLVKISEWIVEKYSSFIVRDLKVAEMFYYDVDWINIGFNKSNITVLNDSSALKSHPIFRDSNSVAAKFEPRQKINGNEEVIDGLRKIIISQNDKIRKCTRCRSLSLINDPLVFSESTVGLWTMVFQRTCVCGSSWANI